MLEDTALSISAPGVLASDADTDGDALTAVLASSPPAFQGSVTLYSDGSFTFSPAQDFNGPTSFTYQARDAFGALSKIASVNINITSVNDPPSGLDLSLFTPEDTAHVFGPADFPLTDFKDLPKPNALIGKHRRATCFEIYAG